MAYKGSIQKLSIGTGGLNGSSNTEIIKPDELVECRNTSLAFGGLTKDGGAAKYNAVAVDAGSSIIGGWDWWPDSSTQRMVVVTSFGSAYKDSGAGTFPVTLASGMAWDSTAMVSFAEGGREAAGSNAKLFIATGMAQVQVLVGDGVTIAAITTPAADWVTDFPHVICNHGGRLWAAMKTANPHRLYYSDIDSMEDFVTADAGQINVFPGDGQYIVALASFKGLLVVLKYPRGVYAVDTSDATPANWKVTKISGAVGGASPRCWVHTADNLIAMDPNGSFFTVYGIQQFGDLSVGSLNLSIWMDDWMGRNTNTALLTKVRAAAYVKRKEVHFALPGVGASVNSMRVIWDFNIPDRPRVRWNDFPNGQDVWLKIDSSNVPRLVTGDNTGFVWLLDQTTKSYDGAGFASQIKTPPLMLAGEQQAARRVNGDFIELIYAPKGTWTITANTYWDGALAESLSIGMGSAGVGLDSFTLDTDVLAGADAVNIRRRITGSGRRFALELVGSGADQDFLIGGMFAGVRPGSEML